MTSHLQCNRFSQGPSGPSAPQLDIAIASRGTGLGIASTRGSSQYTLMDTQKTIQVCTTIFQIEARSHVSIQSWGACAHISDDHQLCFNSYELPADNDLAKCHCIALFLCFLAVPFLFGAISVNLISIFAFNTTSRNPIIMDLLKLSFDVLLYSFLAVGNQVSQQSASSR